MRQNYRLALLPALVVALWGLLSFAPAQADTFGGGGANSFSVDFVHIGQPGNPADNTGFPRPAGSVGYEYRIGKYEISRSMIDKANAEGGLGIALADMTAYGGNGPDKPATGVSWFDAATFVNWMNTSTGHTPAYKFDAGGNFQLWQASDSGYDATNLFRNRNAFYFLPSMNEWYKAAFYNPANGVYWDYPDGSDGGLTPVASGTAPHTAVFLQDTFSGPASITQAGGLSPYGTMAQGGNVSEWEETAQDFVNNNPVEFRGGRGGFWESTQGILSVSIRGAASPSATAQSLSFRIASIVPEPSGLILFLLVLLAVAPLRISRSIFQ